MAMPTDYSATIQDYFRNEFDNTLRAESQLMVKIDDGPFSAVIRKVYLDIHANAKYASFYIPPGEDVAQMCVALAQRPDLALSTDEGIHTLYGTSTTPIRSTATLVFTNKTFLYADAYLSNDERERVHQVGQQSGVVLEIRDRRYADDKAAAQKRDAFISFDWKNREGIARPLAIALCQMLCPVWYAEFFLRPGDNMRDSIEKGLKECKKCIVIVSKQYLANPGWAKTEFDSVFTRERLEKSKVIIPVWYRVALKEVFDYCPSLANTFAVKWLNKKRVNEVAAAIKAQVVAS